MSRSRTTHLFAVAAFAAAAVVAGAVPAAAATAGADPLHDSNVTGSLTLCGRTDQPLTSGNLTTAPFVWKAISSVAAPAPYRSSAGRATLAAYQPLKFVDPGDWSGSQLTGSTLFTNALHPVAQATNGDGPLLNFVQAYPPHFKGYVEIRMLFSGINLPQSIDTYPAAVLKVTGNHWKLVSGGGGSCADGKGTSDETVLLNPKKLKHRQQVVVAGHKAGGNGKNGGKGAARAHGKATKPPTAVTTTPAASKTADSSSGMSAGAKAGIGLGALAVIGAGAAAFSLRRRRGEPSS